MLDAWLAMHNDNLYPCREEKERLAKDMSMTYIQVIFNFNLIVIVVFQCAHSVNRKGIYVQLIKY